MILALAIWARVRVVSDSEMADAFLGSSVPFVCVCTVRLFAVYC